MKKSFWHENRCELLNRSISNRKIVPRRQIIRQKAKQKSHKSLNSFVLITKPLKCHIWSQIVSNLMKRQLTHIRHLFIIVFYWILHENANELINSSGKEENICLASIARSLKLLWGFFRTCCFDWIYHEDDSDLRDVVSRSLA